MNNKAITVAVLVIAVVLGLPLLAKLKTAVPGGLASPTSSSLQDASGGANVEAEYEGNRCSALAAALRAGDRDKVGAFVRAGVNLNSQTWLYDDAAKGRCDYGPAWILGVDAVLRGKAQVDFLRMLFDNGGSVHSKATGKATDPVLDIIMGPAQLAGNPASLAILQLFAEKGFDFNTPVARPGGNTYYLSQAVGVKNRLMVEFLLSKGANPNNRDHRGLTAMGLAMRPERPWPDILPLLQQYGGTQ